MITRPEILECRIAPANTFFVSPLTIDVFKSDGSSAQDTINESQAAGFVGVDKAILLNTGDKIVFDTNHNLHADGSEPVLVSVTTGSAMALFQDIDGDGHFDPSELAGLVVGDGIVATIKGDVSGSIITALAGNVVQNSGGKFNLLHGSIAGLTITGNVLDGIVAGGSITNLKVGKSIYGASFAPSANTILTGTAANGKNFSFGNASKSTNDFVNVNGAGGSITNTTLALGATVLETGAGEDSSFGAGGPGGAITNLTLLDSLDTGSITAGRGGNSTIAAGGDGGVVSKVTIKASLQSNDLAITGGLGGNGTAAGAGGMGGAVHDVTVTMAESFGGLRVFGGSGGTGGATADGGSGGAVFNITAKVPGTLDQELVVFGGDGGDAGSATTHGGTGGTLSKVTLTIANIETGRIHIRNRNSGH